jgi:mono/diheme cytochrome c family protein
MSGRIPEDAAVLRSTRRWREAGVFVFLILVLAFPIYRATEGTRRADALSAENAALMSSGRVLWAQSCMSCHGTMGQGVSAPALNSQHFLTTVTDQQIRGIIAGGVPGTPMPAWWNEYGGSLTDQQIAELVAYIRSWEKTAPSRPDWRTPQGSPG